MKILFTIRTADRSPKANYIWQTLHSLIEGGMDPRDIHLCPTDDNYKWMTHKGHYIEPHLHFPGRHLTPNQNGIRQIELLHRFPADWIVMTEDDLEWCADPLGSIARWLDAHATPERVMYRFFSFGSLTKVSEHASEAPLIEQRGSQAVALRADDALRFARWAKQHPLDWRPKTAPFQNRPHDGFDKLLGYWAAQDNPKVKTGLVSRPFFVRHLGVESSIHSHGVRMDKHFAGTNWSYRSEVHA